MIEQSGHETRDVTVGSSVQRHQLRQYLNILSAAWEEVEVGHHADPGGSTYTHPRSFCQPSFCGLQPIEPAIHITATPAQWEGINQWLQRTKAD